MRRWDGIRIWYPNQKLGVMPLLNMSRSDAKVEIFKVCYPMHCYLDLFCSKKPDPELPAIGPA